MITRLRFVTVLWILAVVPAGHAIAGGYIGISGGSSKDDVLDETASGFKLAVGGSFSDSLDAEIAYVDLGTITIGPFDIEQSGLAASVSPVLKINDQASLFAKVGLFAWTFKVSDSFGSGEDTGTDLFYGFGFEYKISDKLGLIAEYEKYDVSDGDVSLTSLGIRIGL
jgi:hypothetical protein